ncbi:MAG: MlaD family protein [Treponema sp.]|nr:MlaD family protein [Treponema sp.]
MNTAGYIKIALFFIVLGGAGAGYVVLSSSGMNALNTKTYELVLSDASGLSSRSKIYLAGVEVGQVREIQLRGTEAHLKIAFLKTVEIRQNAIISRKASSLLGTSILNLDPGTELTPIIPPGSIISSAPPAGDIDTAMGMVKNVGDQFSLLLDEFRTNQMALLTVSLETINSIAKRIDTQSQDQIKNISRILDSAALISERTDRLLQNREGDISGSVVDIREALANIRSITGEIAAGRGNLGQAVYDANLYNSILTAAQKTEDSAAKLGETLDNISRLAKNADGVVTNAGEIVNKALGLGIQVDAGARYDVLARTARAAASIRLEPGLGSTWYRIGVSSAPDGVASRTVTETVDGAGNRISLADTTETKYGVSVDAELAKKFGFLTLRGGLLESSAGIGMDLQPIKWMSLSGEVFHFQKDE